MATQKQGKKDSSLRDLFAKTPEKKQDFAREVGTDLGGGSSGARRGCQPSDESLYGEAIRGTPRRPHCPQAGARHNCQGAEERGGGAAQRVDTVERTCDMPENELRIIRTLEETEAFLDMDLGQNDPPAGCLDESLQMTQGKQGHAARQRKKKSPKPSERESKKEKEDLLRRLRHQEYLPETGQGL
ncbi:hypothetical protein NDU88_001462 [Pleurodeles waltl]|uniref:Uncharacterized protein n=1 Tax=Pleurodeles waltl TaxID=8319 RepID=A0AAV7R775_PLEWA|nr:hypothetical protein NDU88_001462 [Pleurodeles waltl]